MKKHIRRLVATLTLGAALVAGAITLTVHPDDTGWGTPPTVTIQGDTGWG